MDPGVQVIDHRTVGPYESVTLRSTEGSELVDWLEDNDYVIPPDIGPVIEAYVSEGSDFVALKLRPGQGVQQMTPVRVVTPGGDGVLPLRMVAAGVGDQVDIVLFVISEGRATLPDLVEVHVDPKELEWDFSKNDSNYLRLRASALSENGGFSVLPSYAKQEAFGSSFNATASPTQVAANSFWDLYFTQASLQDDPTDAGDCEGQGNSSLFRSDERIVDEPGLRSLPNSGAFICDGYADLATAFVGLRPAHTWVTRLEMTLPRSALDMDCVVEQADQQNEIDSNLTARKSKNRPDTCEQTLFTSSLARGRPDPSGAALLLLGLGGTLALRRRAHLGRSQR